MYRFFVREDQITDHTIRITGSDVNHIRNVLRMQVGEELAVSNGIDAREYRCEITSFEEDCVVCTLLFIREEGVELPSKVYLFQGLPKADKMELIIQKTVELGIHEIIPVATSRAVVKLDAKKEKSRLERWNAISEAAAKQSKRAVIPQVREVMTMKEAVAYAADMDVKLIPYELAEGMSRTRELIGSLKGGERIAIFIGPEGGFTEQEIVLAQSEGVEPITLGKRILRTETAGFTTLAFIMYQLEED